MTDMNVGRYPRTEPLAVVAAVVLIGAYLLLHLVVGTESWPVVARIGVGLMPAAAIAVAIAIELRIIRRVDELQQRIQLEALAFGYPGAILVIVAIRFLRTEGVLTSWHLGDIWPLLTVPYFVGLALAWRRYK